MKAIILAGGLGSRMGEPGRTTPKPLMEIHGKPILLYQLEALKKEGITDFVFVTCHLSEQIEAYFKDGKEFGVSITYYRETSPLGTAGALFRLGLTEDFLLCNGDLIFDIDLTSMTDFHQKNNALATLFVHPNNHPSDSVTLDTNESSQVVRVNPKNNKATFYQNLCNAGIQIISPELLSMYSYRGKADFDTDIISPAIGTGRIFAYPSAEYVHDAGTPERFSKVSADIASGIVSAKNKRNTQKAVFVDRDGTLNVHKGYITSPEDIELISGVTEAINTFHRLGYLVIMITNQPVIARGDCTSEDLKNIHCRLELLLAEGKAYLDGIYYCPHHPDRGFEGEKEELKISCSCRKPSPGLILQAQKDFNIDLSVSYMIGDSNADVKAGINAGCIPVFIGSTVKVSCEAFNSLKDFSEYLSSLHKITESSLD
ncbi:MAG: D-glycero-beta-D-manno-heptose 1,7-bisphosphate 7-phosphatase [Clostridia bacterium]|nr:D-glycero-beta-D-manno-heptose 1,7-bisphosphate 7-phosphatase [Clostridia bacterium]